MKKKFICTVCGYIYEGEEAPEACPVCKASSDKFKEMENTTPEELIQHCKDTFAGECSEVGMYLAMARQADREGYPEVARTYEHYAYEEAEHAARYAELLGEVLGSTKENLFARIQAEKGACAEKFEMAKLAKKEGNDTLHDTIHEMAKDEARHAAGFLGLYKRFFE